MMENDDPAGIAAEVSRLLNGLKQQDIFVVHRLAKDFGEPVGARVQGRRHGRGRQEAGRGTGGNDRLAPGPRCQQPFIVAGDTDEDWRRPLIRADKSQKCCSHPSESGLGAAPRTLNNSGSGPTTRLRNTT